MKTLKTLKFFPLLIVMVLVSFSCSDDDDNNNPPVQEDPNIVELAQATADLSILVDAVVAADLATTLSGGSYTVLAPTDAAFTAFLATTPYATVEEVPTAVLTQILLNHVIDGEVMASDLIGAGSGYDNTLADGAGGNKMSIYFDTSSGNVVFNGISTVGTADVMASNGVVHIVDEVITLPDVVDHALANSGFSTLVTALTTLTPATDFVSVLSDDAATFSVFAPINDAFDAITIPSDEAVLTQILLNHVINGTAYASGDLAGATGYENTMATTPGGENMSIYFDGTSGVSFNGMSDVIVADVVASNGIIHAVNTVITLPTIATFATSNPALSTLVDALVYADTGTPTVPYITTVSDDSAGPFTVFAPTNDAFGNLLTELSISALTDLDTDTVDAVLLYHIVNGNVQSTGLPNGAVPTIGGEDITADNTVFTLTDVNSRVTNIVTSLVDIQGINGVVHVVDQVLLPTLP